MKRNSNEIMYVDEFITSRASSQDITSTRHRLENLLNHIRDGNIGSFGVKSNETDKNFKKSHREKPKRAKVGKEITYEMRHKTFSLRDTTESIYPMIRKWMYNCDDVVVDEDDDEIPPVLNKMHASPDDVSLYGASSKKFGDDIDLMVTKEIHKMPEPLSFDFEPIPTMKIFSPIENPLPNGSAVSELLKENLSSWKNCKKQHKEYMRYRELKYQPSINLLKTIHAITKQTNN
uniref:Uncharacterized protein n=2 Tax=Panagrolaimus sp. PS1159 TaxID=55785 RepID=A0AC35GUT9_9BILA